MRLQTTPKLHAIIPTINLERNTMTVSAPGVESLVLQLDDDSYQNGVNTIKVCGNQCGGRVWCGTAVADCFSAVVVVQCWLARNTCKDTELMRPPCAPHNFSNEQPILLVSEHAVAALNHVLVEQGQRQVGSRHFRPNIVVKIPTDPEYESKQPIRYIEDGWKRVLLHSTQTATSKDIPFDVVGDCPRCTMVDFAPSTGAKNGETLHTLAKHRRKNGRIVFGIFLKASTTIGGQCWIVAGDSLKCT